MGLHARIWLTAKQKAEHWERWKKGQSAAAISRALERRNKTALSGLWYFMEGLHRRRGDIRQVDIAEGDFTFTFFCPRS
jgi:hypothetical protein